VKLPKNRESGQALIMALILLALGGLLVVPGLNLAMTNLKYHDMIQGETLRAYSADSGVAYGLYEVYNNPEEYQSASLHYSYDINNTTVDIAVSYNATLGLYKITSTATSPNNRSTTIETYVIIEIGLFGNAFACNGNLEVISTDLASLDNPGEFDIYVNGNVDLKDSSVDGDVAYTGVLTMDGSSFINGERFPGAEVLEFPAIDPQPHIDAALAGPSGNYTPPGGVYTAGGALGPIYINGDLDIRLEADTVLEGTVYVTGTVTFDHQTIKGWGDIVAEGNIIMSTYAFNPDNLLSMPLLMSINGDISLDHDGNVGDEGKEEFTQVVLYAPDGKILLVLVTVTGSVAARDITVNQSYIYYPATLKGRADLPGAGLETISYGYK